MFVVCMNSKYGYCRFGKKCSKIHFTDICEDNGKCKEKYCDKRHPLACFISKSIKDANLVIFVHMAMSTMWKMI